MKLKIQCVYVPKNGNISYGFKLWEFYYAYKRKNRLAVYGDRGHIDSFGPSILEKYFRIVKGD